MDSRDNNLVLFASQRKSHARLSLFLLECNVEQLLHKLLWTDVPPPRYFTVLLVRFFWGGSVCLSWLLEPSLSIKKGRSYFCSLFWISCEEYHEFVEWFTGTATPKRCLLLYISSGLLSLSAFICFCFPFGGSVLLYLTGLFYFFSDCFLEIKILWKNSGVCTSEHAVFDNKTWSPLKRLSNINQLLLKCSLLCKYSWSHFN